jgi:hypothetical protein
LRRTYICCLLFFAFQWNALFGQLSIAVNWKDKVFDSIFIQKDIVYGKAADFAGDTVQLTLDLYIPYCPKPSQIFSSHPPLVVMIHGGSFLAGNKDEPSMVQYCRDFAARGYIAAAVNYRLGFVNSSNYHHCNFPNYPCVFAADTAEWYRALFRGIQDVNDALYFLTNEHSYPFGNTPDAGQVFLVGESAGSFIALGTALMDTATEKFPQAGALSSLPQPHNNTASCLHNAGKIFPANIARPDLGNIRGNKPKAPNHQKTTIIGVGNIFGGLMSDLLAACHPHYPKPKIFSYHRPCDLLVPIDVDKVYWGINWCFTNGYNCYAISNLPTVMGSRALSHLNFSNNYGYLIQNHFTPDTFDKQFLIGPYSCVNQVNQPCHGYDNRALRDSLLADFFAQALQPVKYQACEEKTALFETETYFSVKVYPNPFTYFLEIENRETTELKYVLISVTGATLLSGVLQSGRQTLFLGNEMPKGFYILVLSGEKGYYGKAIIKTE